MATKKFLKLEYYRKKYGIKQTDMSQLLGKSLSNYANKESGRTQFYADEMASIRNFLNDKALAAGDARLTVDEIFYTT